MSPLTSTSPAAAVVPPKTQAPALAADGDFKTPGQGHMVKGADGDYKPGSAPASAAATSSSAVLATLSNLKKGG